MVRFDGSLARSLDFGHIPTDASHTRRVTASTTRLWLQGPDKYKVLEKRRRAAQIKARHALDLVRPSNGR